MGSDSKSITDTASTLRFTTALLRRLPRSYAPYYRERGVSISPALAEAQYAAYAAAFEATGLKVYFVDADDRYPDCVFIEDTAVVWRDRALIGRMARHREGEQAAVEEALRSEHRILKLPPGARLEGGDVLRAGDTTYVGLSARTNDEGAASLAELLSPFGARVVTMPVSHRLHLKSAVTYLGDNTLFAAPGMLDKSYFAGKVFIFTEEDEAPAANCLRFNDCLLIPSGYPKTARRLRRFADQRGVQLVPLEISEFEKADGAMTCLSILW